MEIEDFDELPDHWVHCGKVEYIDIPVNVVPAVEINILDDVVLNLEEQQRLAAIKAAKDNYDVLFKKVQEEVVIYRNFPEEMNLQNTLEYSNDRLDHVSASIRDNFAKLNNTNYLEHQNLENEFDNINGLLERMVAKNREELKNIVEKFNAACRALQTIKDTPFDDYDKNAEKKSYDAAVACYKKSGKIYGVFDSVKNNICLPEFTEAQHKSLLLIVSMRASDAVKLDGITKTYKKQISDCKTNLPSNADTASLSHSKEAEESLKKLDEIQSNADDFYKKFEFEVDKLSFKSKNIITIAKDMLKAIKDMIKAVIDGVNSKYKALKQKEKKPLLWSKKTESVIQDIVKNYFGSKKVIDDIIRKTVLASGKKCLSRHLSRKLMSELKSNGETDHNKIRQAIKKINGSLKR